MTYAGLAWVENPPPSAHLQVRKEIVMFFAEVLLWTWLLPVAATFFTWRAGLGMIASSTESRARIWPSMLFLAAPMAILLGLLCLDYMHRRTSSMWPVGM